MSGHSQACMLKRHLDTILPYHSLSWVRERQDYTNPQNHTQRGNGVGCNERYDGPYQTRSRRSMNVEARGDGSKCHVRDIPEQKLTASK